MAERVLSPRALNRALPARRLLLERADLPPVRAVERVGGLHVYGLAEHWLPTPDPPPGEAAGRDRLVTRYLRGFGPASAKDVASFCGWTVTATREVLARLELRRFRDEAGGELLDLPRAPLPSADTPAPARLLPTWDASLLVHARRTQILPEHYRSRVFATSMPQSVPTFLVDGQVAGTWRQVDGRIVLSAFHELPVDAVRELGEEAERLAAFYANG